MSVLIDFSIFPLDKGPRVSPYVARVVGIIQKSGLDHQLGPMGTSIEGDWPEVMGVVDRCFEALQADCERIYFTIKADYRKHADNRLEGKVQSVKSKLE
ncbi:MAG: MTH1187 family thiamine-binding protein [Desulfobacterales bacterium]|nr:MTH1187 family thiamine-binding protein [Desulfobacterales bacterium]